MSPAPSGKTEVSATVDSSLEKVASKEDDASIEIVRVVDREHALNPSTLPKSGSRSLFVDGIKVNVDPDVPALAEGNTEARWTWLDLFRRKKPVYDWNAIATRPSVFDDPLLAPHYNPMYVHSFISLYSLSSD